MDDKMPQAADSGCPPAGEPGSPSASLRGPHAEGPAGRGRSAGPAGRPAVEKRLQEAAAAARRAGADTIYWRLQGALLRAEARRLAAERRVDV